MESIFAGCNRSLGIFDYNENQKILAYGSNNTVSITCPIFDNNGYTVETQVIETLKSSNNIKNGEITFVKWLQKTDILFSGDITGTVNIWKYQTDGFRLLQSLKPTKDSISCIGFTKNDSKCLDFIIGDSKGFVYYYQFNREEHLFTELCNFELPYGYYAMVMNIIKISDNERIILCGGSKPVINVLSVNISESLIDLKLSLPGHDDWVRTIDSVEIETIMETVDDITYPRRNIIFASGSLDRIIRLWKLTIKDSNTPVYVETNKLKLLTSKEYKFETLNHRYCIFLDAILMGHDDWVSEVSWKGDTNKEEELMLLSSGADSSVMIWQADKSTGVWFPEVRLGELAIKGASTATGSSGGFYSSKWIINKELNIEIILTNGKTGSFRCWTKQGDETFFQTKTTLNGPMKPISDISWSKGGDYLLVTSYDQTTRLYCKPKNSYKWFEFGRPQIHGFDMITVKSISDTRFISAGDEKIIRVFDMPKSIASMLNKFCGIESLGEEQLNGEKLPEYASVPVLGLSNKSENDKPEGVEDGDDGEDDGGYKGDGIKEIIEPPIEDILQRHTLWPEIEKLYGHGFEITTVDVSNDGKIISSACRSNVSRHSVIRNFNSETWLECEDKLSAHDLTITRLRYSLNDEDNKDEYLLSVSRDRKFSLWKRLGGENFELIKIMEKAHSRIIWDCAWVNFGEVISFLTCSRDKEVKLWKMDNESKEVKNYGSIKFEIAVTAIDSVKINNNGIFKVIIGLDNGKIFIYRVDVNKNEFEEIEAIENRDLPGDSISRISISNKVEVEESGEIKHIVAIGSKDNSLRIMKK